MHMNNLETRLRNHFSQLTNSLLTVCMLLGLGLAGAQAQVPEADIPGQFYFKVGDEITNEITSVPGDSFVLIVGYTSAGPCDGATVSLNWDPTLVTIPETQPNDLIGSQMPFPFGDWTINHETGYFSWTKAIFGGAVQADMVDGVAVPTNHDLLSITVQIPDDALNATEVFYHSPTPNIDQSALAYQGSTLIYGAGVDEVPTFTVNIDAGYDCPDAQQNFGDACDDGDPLTENDIRQDDCSCAGTPITPVYDCPDVQQNFGDACDDGDPLTENDIRQDDCSCAGTPIAPIYDCPDAEQNFGDACDDGDPLTENDIRQDDCSCAGTPIAPIYDCPDAEQNFGDACDDGDPLTENDIRQDDCSCAGTPIAPIYDCPDAEQNFGDACDDGDPLTENDIRQDDCSCAGTPIAPIYDCPDVEQNFGDACDDGDPLTENDIRQDDCSCAGTPIAPVFDCPDVEQNFGDACDDGDPNTTNDVRQEDCSCAGTPIVPSTCDNFVYFLSDHSAADGISDIYKVTLNGGNADLEYIATSDIEVHIAYNPIDNLIYAVSKHTNSYRVLDPYAAVPVFGPTVDLGADYGELTAAVFNADGKLLIGSQNNNAIYSVNVATNVVSTYDTYAPVAGGDLAFASDGMLYLATRTGNGLYEVWPADVMPDQFIGSVPNNVTGMAITDTDQLLISSRDNTNLVVRNTAGSDAGSYEVMLNGESYTLRDGDMASGCDTHENVEDGCDYKLYYIHSPSGGGNEPLLEVTLNGDGTASYNAIIANLGGHIGLSPDGSTIYDVNGSSLKVIDVATASVINTVTVKTAGGQVIGGNPAVVVGSNGSLYVGSSNTNQVYIVDPASGIAIPYGPSRTVNGGDLIEVDAEIWLITRNNNTFTNVMTGASFTVPVNEINGAAVLSNGNVLLADGNGGSLMKEVDLSTQMVVGTYDIGLPLYNGDLAGGCTNTNNIISGCYGVEVLDFSQGPQTNGSAVPANRSDASQALGEPDRSNAAGGFVSLGVGGSITIAFAGVINDAPGNDIKIWETSFSGDVCGGADDEQADIELSYDGVVWASAGSICRDGEVDLADAGLAAVRYIRITNAASTGSLDGYDVDGVEALNGCSSEPVVDYGDCYASEMIDYVQGVKSNGGAIDINRTDANEALGMPERTDELVFVSLGYGGSLTLGFNGAVPNGAGDDIEVVETTFNNNSCGSYPEFADVYVSVDGDVWYFAKTICRADGFVDIDDADPSLEYINYVRIVNNDAMSNTPDAFDVDGVVALYNCEVGRPAAAGVEAESTITSYPNPTSGPSQVVFVTAETGTTLVEVYDMNGRNVATLFNQVANANQEYRLDFDGNRLPNGVYIYRMTTNNETIIDKFMIAK